MPSKAVPDRQPSFHGAKEKVESLPGKIPGPILRQEPAMERPSYDGPGPAREPRHSKAAVTLERAQRVDPGLEGLVILLNKFPGKCRTCQSVPFRSPNPLRDDIPP